MSRYIYGIDFGTSNSALAILDTVENKIIKTFSEGSLIFFREVEGAKPLIGKQALDQYFENEMMGRFMKSIKTVLPRKSFTQTIINGKKYKAEDLVALILTYLKQKADDFVGENITSAVFGRPVVFDENAEKDALAQERLEAAAKLAGFQTIHFQYEPIAAAFTYERLLTKKEQVLVADFGAGTSDFTIMQLDPTKAGSSARKNDMLAKGGIHIGGDDFDADIMWDKMVKYFGYGLSYESNGKMLDVPVHYFRRLCHWEDMFYFKNRRTRQELDYFHYETKRSDAIGRLITLVDNNLGYSVLKSIEQAKIDLAENDNTFLNYANKDIFIHEPFSISEFGKTIGEDVDAIEQYLLAFLEENNIKSTDIDNVFMTGGSSLVRPIQHIFNKHFGAQKIQSGETFNSVVYGLAYSYYLFQD